MQSVLPFIVVAQQIGYTPAAAYVSRSRGIFPVRVRQIGGKLVCFSSDFNDYLSSGASQAHLSVSPLKKAAKAKAGRPSKSETLQAAALGLSVTALRAQHQQDLKKAGGDHE